MRFCECGRKLGPRARLCRNCRRRAQRRWEAGLSADYYAEGGQRGRLPLNEPSAEERREQELERARAQAFEEGRRAGRDETLAKLEPFIAQALGAPGGR